jgi:hypothetical protein
MSEKQRRGFAAWGLEKTGGDFGTCGRKEPGMQLIPFSLDRASSPTFWQTPKRSASSSRSSALARTAVRSMVSWFSRRVLPTTVLKRANVHALQMPQITVVITSRPPAKIKRVCRRRPFIRNFPRFTKLRASANLSG